MHKSGRLRLPMLLGCVVSMLGAAPALAVPYKLDTLMSVPAGPGNTDGGDFLAFDIGFVDDSAGTYYIADRSNASVDVFSTATNTFITRINGFTGHLPSSDVSGPDGILVTNLPGQHDLWAGNGDSTLHGFNVDAGYTVLPNTPITTGPAADKRVDEMAFDPHDQRLLVVNDAASPSPFISLINTSNNTIAVQTTFNGLNGTPNATGGLEQPVWDPTTKKFYLSVPQVNGTGPGAVAEIDTNGNVVHVFDLASFGIASCAPSGLARGAGGRLLIGCTNAGTQTILFDPKANGGNGAILKTFNEISGSDQVWYDPKTHRFFIAASNNIGGPVLGIIALGSEMFLGDIPTSPGAHSVAVDPVTGDVFVPYGGIVGNTACPVTGCIAVFSPIPEPGSLPILASAVAVLLGCGWRFRRSRAGR